jgi:hypothetical protein
MVEDALRGGRNEKGLHPLAGDEERESGLGDPANFAAVLWDPPPPIVAERRQMTGVALVIGSAPMLVAFIVGLLTDFGRRANPEIAVVLAQVVPVVFLAAVVENRVIAARLAERFSDDKTMVEVAITGVRASVVLFLFGEATALYAVGTSTLTTFLVLTPCLTTLVQVVLLFGALKERITPLPPNTDRDT